jgi:RimJ/RimL family protein N-acetyltransferase
MLTTTRLHIRPMQLDDTSELHRILNACFGADASLSPEQALAERRSYVKWCGLSQKWFGRLHQPPYGERAVLLSESGALIGAVGLVPCLNRFEQIPALQVTGRDRGSCTPEVGLFWAIDPARQCQGYATEAAAALIKLAFEQLNIARIIATTEYDNLASQGVMRKLGMKIERNPQPGPPWLQVVGVLESR